MRSLVWVIALFVVGCAHKKAAAPTTSNLDLAGKHVSYRDWRGQDACAADKMVHWSDFEAWKALLTEFNAQTAAGPDDTSWTAEQIATLEAATQTLGPALDALDSQVSGVGKCKNFPKSAGVEDGAKEADALAQTARKKLTDAPTLLPKLKEKLELNKWKATQAEAMKTGKESWCGAKPSADVYYGAVDETGTTEWLFCDETKVTAAEGAKPEVHVEAGKKKPHNAKQYLDAALKYPASELQRAPKPGAKAVAGDDAEKKPEG